MRDFGLLAVQEFGAECLRDFANYFEADHSGSLGTRFVLGFGEYLVEVNVGDFVRDLEPDVVRDFGQRTAMVWGVDPDIAATALWEDFATLRAASVSGLQTSGRKTGFSETRSLKPEDSRRRTQLSAAFSPIPPGHTSSARTPV